MGTWTLEVFKLGLYVTFPVALFYIFNQPKLFEDWVIQTKRELYPPECETPHAEIAKFVKEMKAKHQDQLIEQMQQDFDALKK